MVGCRQPRSGISPHISPYLPTSRCREQVINGVSLANLFAKLDAGNIEPKELAAPPGRGTGREHFVGAVHEPPPRSSLRPRR